MQQYQEVHAVFKPMRTDDLHQKMVPFIGKSSTFMAAWVIEDGPYKGQWAMQNLNFDWPPYPVPECDLEIMGGGLG